MMNKSFMRAAILGFTSLSALVVLQPAAKADQVLSIPLASVKILQLQQPARDVIIADPGIADITMQAPDRMVLIGKQAGRTSLIVLDANQKVLLSRMVVVSDGDGGLVVVHGPRGGTMSQDSYACAEHCNLIPGSGIGGSGGGGAFKNNPLSAETVSGQANDPGKVQRVDTKLKMKVSPNGVVTGTRTDVPVYGTSQ
jgi:hypothetical protein